MKIISKLEANFISGGVSTLEIVGSIALTSTAAAFLIYAAVNYQNSIDFSKLTSEEAYQKGLEDRYGYAILS
jgi:hypothetical protein